MSLEIIAELSRSSVVASRHRLKSNSQSNPRLRVRFGLFAEEQRGLFAEERRVLFAEEERDSLDLSVSDLVGDDRDGHQPRRTESVDDLSRGGVGETSYESSSSYSVHWVGTDTRTVSTTSSE